MWNTKTRIFQETLQLWRTNAKIVLSEKIECYQNQVLIPRTVHKITILVQT